MASKESPLPKQSLQRFAESMICESAPHTANNFFAKSSVIFTKTIANYAGQGFAAGPPAAFALGIKGSFSELEFSVLPNKRESCTIIGIRY
jgi:hypothetical protein